MTSYLVVGGGVAGLTAADELLRRDPTAEVTLLEGSDRVGGKIRAGAVAGVSVDVGAEAVLARRPEALELMEHAGLGGQVVHPTGASAQIWSRGRLHRVPPRTLMGVPADPGTLTGLLTDDEVDRVRHETPGVRPGPDEDVPVGELVGSRLGRAVVDRLVEPLLGGVYAGSADLLSAASALPGLLAAARAGEPLLAAVDRVVPAGGGTQAPAPRPVFATLAGGLHRLPAALTGSLESRGARVVLGTVARELHRRPDGGWEVVTGPRPRPTSYLADRVVLAVPAAPAARLLRPVSPEAAGLLGEVETASMAVVTLAYGSRELGELQGSGFLVPPVDGRTVKASTFSAAKWDWVREAGRGAGPDGQDLTLLRVSVGRHREEATLQVPDADLVAVCRSELAAALGRDLPSPVDAHVQRWGGGLPQHAVGHQDRIARVRAALASVPGLAACGAAFDGVGIPACIASARRAVEDLG
ncbi:protoporphyrinogen oxidase [Ornithinimicrobium sp. CNJ-824]|uniref:protoporphyrinogen oxidase n=1 Tax=Ornithinimicrobium sp. CNJ-824 TaxID=1904966 RepID=UPI0009659265|nr:protoporphyrinogen oxidase [Ornithinimicrobium sp. CNJ-824]OLT23698.1 protoporphyrinogen oxidase [Ornithinimicrobium sp. CNJ-824]